MRPTSVTVFAILNLVFGGLGLCGTVMNVVLFSARPGIGANPVLDMMMADPALAAWMYVSVAAGGVGSMIYIASGIGMLALRRWAWLAALVYAGFSIVMGIVGTAFTAAFFFGPMMERAGELRGPEQAAMIGGAVGGVVGGLMSLVYPVLLLYFLTRPRVKAAFGGDPPGPPGARALIETGNPYQSPP